MPPKRLRLTRKAKGGVFGFDLKADVPKPVREFLDREGDKRITSISICRVPLNSRLLKVLNVITLGQLNKVVKEKGYDTFFHLFMHFHLENGRSYIMEKNERVEITANLSQLDSQGTQCIPVTMYQPNSLTLNEFFSNAVQRFPKERLFIYDVVTQNCQRFQMDLLEANGLLTNRLEQFILQDAAAVVKKSGLLNKASNFITNIAHRARHLISGGAPSTLSPWIEFCRQVRAANPHKRFTTTQLSKMYRK